MSLEQGYSTRGVDGEVVRGNGGCDGVEARISMNLDWGQEQRGQSK